MTGNFRIESGRCWGAVMIAALLAILLFSVDVVFGLSLTWGAAGMLHLPMTSLPWLAIPVVAAGVWVAVWIFRTAYAAELRNRLDASTTVDDFPADAFE
jgi:hypothetical protein